MYMKTSIYVKTLLIVLFALALGAVAFGQATPAETPQPTAQKPPDVRTAALGQLGLSREQIQQIRRVNMERKPLMDAAQTRLKEANRLLDETIYSDQATETDVQARLKEAQLAQAEVARIRFMNEFAVRRVLTPDQLVRFRDLRQKFELERANANKNGPSNGPAAVKPMREIRQEIKQGIRPNKQKP